MVEVRIDREAIVGEVEIAGPAERVFRALTEPERLRSWWGSRESYWVERWRSDLQVGGAWEATGIGSTGQPFRVHGVFVEIDPPRRLVYTWNASWLEAPETTVIYELVPIQGHGERTLVQVRHEGFGGARAALEDHAHGWPAVLGWLRSYFQRPWSE